MCGRLSVKKPSEFCNRRVRWDHYDINRSILTMKLSIDVLGWQLDGGLQDTFSLITAVQFLDIQFYVGLKNHSTLWSRGPSG